MSDTIQPMANPMIPRLTYTVQEAAKMLGVSRRTIYELIDRKKLPACKVLGRRLIRAQALEDMLDEAQDKAA